MVVCNLSLSLSMHFQAELETVLGVVVSLFFLGAAAAAAESPQRDERPDSTYITTTRIWNKQTLVKIQCHKTMHVHAHSFAGWLEYTTIRYI